MPVDKILARITVYVIITALGVLGYLWTKSQDRIDALEGGQKATEAQTSAQGVEIKGCRDLILNVDRKVDKLLDIHLIPTPPSK